jgi:protein-disulfide isomerase
VLREVAEAVPQLDVEQWQEDFESPRSEELVRQDAMLAAELQLPAEPAVVVSGPGGQRELIESPSAEEIEAAIDAVGQS